MKTLALAAFLFALMITAMAETHGTVRGVSANLRVESATGVVGDVVPVNINVVGMPAPGLGAWTVDVTWDATSLSLASQGVLGRGCQPYFGGVCSMRFTANVGRFTGASAAGLVGDFTLGTAFFRCEVPGMSPITLRTNVFADAAPGNPQITVSPEGGTITCFPAAATATALPAATPGLALPPSGEGGQSQPGVPAWLAALLAIGAFALAGGALVTRRQR